MKGTCRNAAHWRSQKNLSSLIKESLSSLTLRVSFIALAELHIIYRSGRVWRGFRVSNVTGFVQLRLAYKWARPILVAGKCRGECFYFFCFFTFIPVCLSLPFPSLSSPLLSLFSLSLGYGTKWPIRADGSLIPNSINVTDYMILFYGTCSMEAPEVRHTSDFLLSTFDLYLPNFYFGLLTFRLQYLTYLSL